MIKQSMKSDLEIAILWLEGLLENSEKKESSYQEFFEQNPIVFRILGYKNYYPFTKESGSSLPRDHWSDLKPEPDFIVERPNGIFEIFEIKTPVSKKLRVDSNRYREKFTSEVNSYISQVITYAEYFKNPQNVERVRDMFGIEIHEDLDIKIVIGLSEYIDKIKVHRQARRYKYEIDIITYDEILSQLEDEYQLAYGDYQKLPGIALVSFVRFRSAESAKKKYFLDIGTNTENNRIALYLDRHNDICFSILDDKGKTYELRVETEAESLLEEWICLTCEFGKAKNGFVMLMSINGIEMDKRIKGTSVNLSLPLNQFTLGCDINQENFGYFDSASILIFKATLPFRTRYKLLGSLLDKYHRSVEIYSEFGGQQFLYCDNSGNLTQDKKRYQPLIRLAT